MLTCDIIEEKILRGERLNSDEGRFLLSEDCDLVALGQWAQKKRFEKAGRNIKLNSEMNTRDLIALVPIKEEVKEILNASAARFDLSARAYHRVMKLARTIADLDAKNDIEVPHILEALQYRPKVRN